MKLGRQFKKARQDADKTQQEVADAVGKNDVSISNMENGKTSNYSLMEKVADHLGYDVVLKKREDAR